MKQKVFSLLALIAVFVSISVKAQVVSLGQVVYPTSIIGSGSSTSLGITTAGLSLVGCQLPASFTGTSISFQVSTSINGTYQELDNSSGKVSYTVTQGKYIAINPVDFYGVQFLKIVSNATEGATRTFICSMKGI